MFHTHLCGRCCVELLHKSRDGCVRLWDRFGPACYYTCRSGYSQTELVYKCLRVSQYFANTKLQLSSRCFTYSSHFQWLCMRVCTKPILLVSDRRCIRQGGVCQRKSVSCPVPYKRNLCGGGAWRQCCLANGETIGQGLFKLPYPAITDPLVLDIMSLLNKLRKKKTKKKTTFLIHDLVHITPLWYVVHCTFSHLHIQYGCQGAKLILNWISWYPYSTRTTE